jgi:hypothetical protein
MHRQILRIAAAAACLLIPATPFAQTPSPLDPDLVRMGEYVAAYGEKASVIVAVEKYTQSVNMPEATVPVRPRQLVAEFAIVKAGGQWVGYRDVVEVNGQKVGDRRDRLMTLLTDAAPNASAIMAIANESARYNIGPVTTNLNVPTTTMFFFLPENLPRFMFTKGAQKKIDGVQTVEYVFKETRSPTLVMKRDGTNVPLEGSVWIVPGEGTVVRTRLRVRGFADTVTTNMQSAPAGRPPVNPNTPTGGREAIQRSQFGGDPMDQRDVKSVADIEVTYTKDDKLGLWLPSKMSEQYEGQIKFPTRPPFQGMSTTRATYSDFKQFGTGTRITIK